MQSIILYDTNGEKLSLTKANSDPHSKGDVTNKQVKERLEYLRGEILAERISYSELAELQELSIFIEENDTLLLEWAGVPEKINY